METETGVKNSTMVEKPGIEKQVKDAKGQKCDRAWEAAGSPGKLDDWRREWRKQYIDKQPSTNKEKA